MYTYLFFDTETTGVPRNYKAPLTDFDNWPRLVQLAYQAYDDKGKLIADGDVIIKPEGWTIPAEASAIHGITQEQAEKEGLSLNSVLHDFRDMIEGAKYLVAHNMGFDECIVGSEFLRAGMPNLIQEKNRLCTMLATVDFCALPGRYGFKWPKLSELHRKLFNEDFSGAHNAAVDIEATAKCFFELQKREIAFTNLTTIA